MIRVRYIVSAFLFLCSVDLFADSQGKAHEKPVLAEMQNMFSLIKTLKKENSELKEQLKTQEDFSVRAPAQAKSSKKDPSLVVVEKAQYERMVKELQSLKAQVVQKEKLLQEMEDGL